MFNLTNRRLILSIIRRLRTDHGKLLQELNLTARQPRRALITLYI